MRVKENGPPLPVEEMPRHCPCKPLLLLGLTLVPPLTATIAAPPHRIPYGFPGPTT